MAVMVAPTAGAARKWPKPLGTSMEDIAREHREHRRRAAEKDSEQVEADRPEHQAIVADVAQALDHLRPRIGPARNVRAINRRNAEQADQGRGRTVPHSPHKARKARNE